MKFLGCVDEGLHRKCIEGGFCNAGIYPLNPEIVTSHLPPSCPDPLKSKRKTRAVDIGNQVVSDPIFLEKWEMEELVVQNKKSEEINKKRISDSPRRNQKDIKKLKLRIEDEENSSSEVDDLGMYIYLNYICLGILVLMMINKIISFNCY